MFGWRHCCSTLISRMDVTGMPASKFHILQRPSYTHVGFLRLCVDLQHTHSMVLLSIVPSRSLSILTFLRATTSPVVLSLALSAGDELTQATLIAYSSFNTPAGT